MRPQMRLRELLHRSEPDMVAAAASSSVDGDGKHAQTLRELTRRINAATAALGRAFVLLALRRDPARLRSASQSWPRGGNARHRSVDAFGSAHEIARDCWVRRLRLWRGRTTECRARAAALKAAARRAGGGRPRDRSPENSPVHK